MEVRTLAEAVDRLCVAAFATGLRPDVITSDRRDALKWIRADAEKHLLEASKAISKAQSIADRCEKLAQAVRAQVRTKGRVQALLDEVSISVRKATETYSNCREQAFKIAKETLQQLQKQTTDAVLAITDSETRSTHDAFSRSLIRLGQKASDACERSRSCLRDRAVQLKLNGNQQAALKLHAAASRIVAAAAAPPSPSPSSEEKSQAAGGGGGEDEDCQQLHPRLGRELAEACQAAISSFPAQEVPDEAMAIENALKGIESPILIEDSDRILLAETGSELTTIARQANDWSACFLRALDRLDQLRKEELKEKIEAAQRRQTMFRHAMLDKMQEALRKIAQEEERGCPTLPATHELGDKVKSLLEEVHTSVKIMRETTSKAFLAQSANLLQT